MLRLFGISATEVNIIQLDTLNIVIFRNVFFLIVRLKVLWKFHIELYSNKFCVNYESPIVPVMTKDIRLTSWLTFLPICHYVIEV